MSVTGQERPTRSAIQIDLAATMKRVARPPSHSVRGLHGSLPGTVATASWRRFALASSLPALARNRYVARYWEVRRHRVPPATARQIGLLRSAGRLSVLRGRVIEASDTSAGVRVSIGFGESQAELRAGWLIN